MIRYQDPTLQEKLAAEYVMGSLTGQARRRFEKLQRQYPEIQVYVSAWNSRLHPLTEDIEPVTPPASVWSEIMAHIEKPRPPLWQRPGFRLRAVMLAASVLIVLSLFMYFRGNPGRHFVVVKNRQAQVEWVVEANTRFRHVMVRTINPPALPENKVCILWLTWKDGKTRPVGVLPDKVGRSEMQLPGGLANKPELANIVVSVETRGSNPDNPSGEIVFSGPWLQP